MDTEQELHQNNSRLAFYHENSDPAERIFHEKIYINYQLSATKYLGSRGLELLGCTALHFAARFNRKLDIEFLLSRSADCMIKHKNGLTPLLFAVEGNCELLSDFYEMKDVYVILLSAQVESENTENPRDKNGLSHFHMACMLDHAVAIEFFLKNGILIDEPVNVDSKYFPGYTPIHFAATYSAYQAIELLVNHGANTRLKNAQGATFIRMLLEIRTEIIQWYPKYSRNFSDVKKVELDNLKILNFLLLNDKYSIDYADLPRFHLACSLKNVSLAERLLPNIFDINQTLDTSHWAGYTALHIAAHSSIEMVKMLLKNEANILAKDVKGVTPLDVCIEKYPVEDIHSVLSLDANWQSILMSDRKTRLLTIILAMKDERQFDNFLETRLNVINTFVLHDSSVWQGFTLLHIAVMFYREEKSFSRYIIRKLIAKGVNINARDIHGRSPVHQAYCQFGSTKKELIEELLKFNDEIEDVVDEDDLSHLHIACKMNIYEAVEKILQTTVDVNLQFKGKSNLHGIIVGSTPLHCAATNEKIVKLLLLHGADPHLKDNTGMTAIHCSAGLSETLLTLPELKDCVVSDTGLSYLHIASYAGNVCALKQLLDAGANVNERLLQDNVLDGRGKFGDTPLDFAFKGDMELIGLLLDNGANFLVNEPDAFNRDTSNRLKSFVSSLTSDDFLFKRLEKDIGLTMLHVACSRIDVILIQELIRIGADVNARLNLKSRLWPGFTPLHVVTDVDDHDTNLDEIVRLLMDHNADITMTTELNLAYDNIPENLPSNRYSCIQMILRAHKDFSVNPIRQDGLSYFHLACSIGDIITIKQFLKHDVDVNQRTGLFEIECYRNTGGCSPLHLAAACIEYAVDYATQLELIDVLLNCGADVHAVDVNANTPLHFMAQWNYKREDVIIRLVEFKINVNFRNIWGETSLEVLLKTNESLSVGGINCFLKIGCIFNLFNAVSEKGLIARALPLISNEDLISFIKNSMLKFPHLMRIDEMGRTVIHNIVSDTNIALKETSVISDFQYVRLIQEIEEFDLHIDDQDNLGRTALHLAALFRNTEAVSGLLMGGADVNITDAHGKTAFSYLFESCVRCFIADPKNIILDHKQYSDHSNLFSKFVIHMKKLLVCKLHLNQLNVNLMFEAFEKIKDVEMPVPKLFDDQISEIKELKIAQTKLTFGNFLCETEAVVAYQTLPLEERDAIDKFFKNEIFDFSTTYSEVTGVLCLQYQKAVKRIALKKLAKFAINVLARIAVPDLCSTAILRFLTNSELSCMVAATAQKFV